MVESKAVEDDDMETSSIQIFIQEEPECQVLSQNPCAPSGTRASFVLRIPAHLQVPGHRLFSESLPTWDLEEHTAWFLLANVALRT